MAVTYFQNKLCFKINSHLVHNNNGLEKDIQIAATNVIGSAAGLSLKYENQMVRITK